MSRVSQASLSLPDLRVTDGQPVEVGVKAYFNGFPKSGLHLATLLAGYLSQPWVIRYDADGNELPQDKRLFWNGTFDPAWSNNWRDLTEVLAQIEYQPEGSWMKGHVGYHPDIAAAVQEAGTAFAFVYRDLRDVAVSAAYHVEDGRTVSDDGLALVHPGKAEYMELPDHESRLLAVIEGLNDWPGLIERWELYAPWLDVEWVFPVRFEWLRYHSRWMAGLYIEYAMQATGRRAGLEITLEPEQYLNLVSETAALLGTTEHSFTFRKGTAGQWREEFTPQVKAAFKERAGDWLVRLGYEEDNDW